MRILNSPHHLKSEKVLLIDEKGAKRGEVRKTEAFNIAREEGVNLAVVSEKSTPPTVRLIDWGKYQYEQKKKEKKARFKQKAQEIKEIRLSSNIDKHDIEFKRRQAEKFLEKGHSIKLNLKLKGRQHQFIDQAIKVIVDFGRKLRDSATVEQTPKRMGGFITSVLRPKQK